MKPSAGDFDLPLGVRCQPQHVVRPDPPARSVNEFARFLAEMEELFGPRESAEPRTRTIDRYLL